jgi:cell division protein FtsN
VGIQIGSLRDLTNAAERLQAALAFLGCLDYLMNKNV